MGTRLGTLMTVLTRFVCLLVLTVAPSAVNAFTEVVYYHNDIFGNPAAMTDSSGNVVWKESYAPYGERTKNQDNGTNKLWFQAKPSDADTGLSYFGARYYDPAIGRFMSMDSMGVDEKNLHSFNRYAYANNNPYKYTDPDGKWATYIHKKNVEEVLSFLPASDIGLLKNQQEIIDQNQSNAVQFKHALRIPGQTARESWETANKFVRDELNAARGLEDVGSHDQAIEHLGNAIHTMQDATSPSHRGFQLWDVNGSALDHAQHLWAEKSYPVGADLQALSAATARAWDLFKGRTPLPQQILPAPSE